jgi:membrane associated rhomboid family serine protease
VVDVAQRFSLPEPRPRDGWFKAGPIDVTTTAFIVGCGIVSMFVYAVNPDWIANLAFTPQGVRSGRIWQIVTWPLVTVPSIWVLISLFFFWYFGHMVEEMVGRLRYTRLVAAIVIAPALFVSVTGFISTDVQYGIRLLGLMMLVIFAAEHPEAPFFFSIPAWVVTAVFLGLEVLGYLAGRFWSSLIVLVLAVAISLVTVRQWGFADRLDMIPRFRTPAHRSPTRSRRGRVRPAKRGRSGSSRGAARVVDGPWAAPSGSAAPSPDTAALQAELDALLDKISSGGLDSLSSAEKQRLNELSKRLR